MAESAAVLIAAGIIVPIVVLLIYAALRTLFTSARNLKVAVESELAHRKLDADPVQSAESVPSRVRSVRQTSRRKHRCFSRKIGRGARSSIPSRR